MEEVAKNEEGSAPVSPTPTSVSEADVSGISPTGKALLSACKSYIASDGAIQDEFLVPLKELPRIGASMSAARMKGYLSLASQDALLAVRLHYWNAAVCGSLLPTLQITEVAIRNFALRRLMSTYTKAWYTDSRLLRKLGTSRMADQLDKAVRDEQARGRTGNLTDHITSELPFGFWVNVFTQKFATDVWSRPLHTYSASMPKGGALTDIYLGVDEVRKFRNDIAHHKNVVFKPVEASFGRALEVLSWFCPGSHALAKATATFPNVWASSPLMRK